MEHSIYAIHDTGAGIYLTPLMTSKNDVAPLRELNNLANDPASLFHKHARDFDLVHLGTINLETGYIEAAPHRVVANAADVQARQA